MEPKINEANNSTFTAKQKISYYADHITTLSHVLIIWYVFYTWYVAIFYDGWDLGTLSLHATLYVTGWTFLMLEGIMAIAPNNLVSRHLSHDARNWVHTVLQIMSGAFCLAGYLILYLNSSQHLTTPHSKTGFASLVLTLPTWINGLAAVYAVELKKYVSPGCNKVIHSVFGIATYVVGTVSLYYGVEKGWYRGRVSADTLIFTKVVILFTLIWGLLQPLLTCFERIKYMF